MVSAGDKQNLASKKYLWITEEGLVPWAWIPSFHIAHDFLALSHQKRGLGRPTGIWRCWCSTICIPLNTNLVRPHWPPLTLSSHVWNVESIGKWRDGSVGAAIRRGSRGESHVDLVTVGWPCTVRCNHSVIWSRRPSCSPPSVPITWSTWKFESSIVAYRTRCKTAILPLFKQWLWLKVY